jgi:hypothetical protein
LFAVNSGKIGNTTLRKPKVANLSITAAKRIEPPNGLSECALNNHKWNG